MLDPNRDDGPFPLWRVLAEEYERLHCHPPPNVAAAKTSQEKLSSVIKDIHQQKHSAVCLSGGGIRSSTFSLGVLQELARKGLLEKFTYLSTVSGGGYVGGWLSAWIHRNPNGIKGVVEELKGRSTSMLEPEPVPIRHLRSYSNYLTPRLGFFSADSWTLAATLVRNLLLNWLVLLPLLLVVLTVPRIFLTVTRNPPDGYFYVMAVTIIFAIALAMTGIGNKRFKLGSLLITILIGGCATFALLTIPLMATLLIGFIGGVICITYIGVKRPSSAQSYNDLEGFLKWCFLPLIMSASSLALFWAWFDKDTASLSGELRSLASWFPELRVDLEINPLPFVHFVLFGTLMYASGWFLYSTSLGHFSFWRKGWLTQINRFRVYEFFSILISGAVTGFFLWLMAYKLIPEIKGLAAYPLLYACISPTLYLLLFLLAITIFAGITSEYALDEDREWWARFSAWVLIAVTGWSIVSLLVLFGPSIVENKWDYLLPGGGVIGFVTAKLASSAYAPANTKSEQQTGKSAGLMKYALVLGSFLFMLLLIAFLSYLTSYLLYILESTISHPLGGANIDFIKTRILSEVVNGPPHPFYDVEAISTGRPLLLLFFIVFIGLLGYFFSRSINTNKFSHHGMYRNRLIRAYLGASNEHREPNPFTGFDSEDNIPMYELRPELFHHGSFRNFKKFIDKLKDERDQPAIYFKSKLRPDTLQYLEEYKVSSCQELWK